MAIAITPFLGSIPYAQTFCQVTNGYVTQKLVNLRIVRIVV